MRQLLIRPAFLIFVSSAALTLPLLIITGSPAAGAEAWPDSGSDTARIQDVTLGQVDWARGDAVAYGTAYTTPGADPSSDSYWRAAYRARRQALVNLELLLVNVARGRHHALDTSEVRRAALHAVVVDRKFHRSAGKLTLTVAAALYGEHGALAADRPEDAPSFNPYDPAFLDGASRRTAAPAEAPPAVSEASLPTIDSAVDASAQVEIPLEIDGPRRDPAPLEIDGHPPVQPSTVARPYASGALERTPDGQQGPFTGVVIDCRGLGLLSSMSPRIRTPDGREVWGSVKVDPRYAEEVGIAGFMEEWDKALAYEPRVGQHPLMLRAIDVTGGRSRSQAVIGDADAARLLRENDKTHFLNNFHVMFVVDPLQL